MADHDATAAAARLRSWAWSVAERTIFDPASGAALVSARAGVGELAATVEALGAADDLVDQAKRVCVRVKGAVAGAREDGRRDLVVLWSGVLADVRAAVGDAEAVRDEWLEVVGLLR